MDEFMKEMEGWMKDVVEFFVSELCQVCVGCVLMFVFEGVMVDYYGIVMLFNQVVNFLVVDVMLFVVQFFDLSFIDVIECGIIIVSFGFNLSNDGKVVCILILLFIEECCKELVKQVYEMVELSCNVVCGVCCDGNDYLKLMEKEKEISQDDEYCGYDEMQKLYDKYIVQINVLFEVKEKDIFEV